MLELELWALSEDCSNDLCPRFSDVIVREIEASQRCTNDEHSYEASRPVAPNVIDLKIKGLQRWSLRQDSGHNVSPVVVDVIGSENEVPEQCTL